MTTKKEMTLDTATISEYQKMAEQELIKICTEHKDVLDIKPADIGTSIYPYGGSFTIAGIGYLKLSSVTPMEFTNGVKLTYLGEGGGAVFGGGVFAGAGVFRVDPATLNREECAFLVAGTPGIVGGLSITWFQHGLPIGNFQGIGVSAFVGGGGGTGHFTRL